MDFCWLSHLIYHFTKTVDLYDIQFFQALLLVNDTWVHKSPSKIQILELLCISSVDARSGDRIWQQHERNRILRHWEWWRHTCQVVTSYMPSGDVIHAKWWRHKCQVVMSYVPSGDVIHAKWWHHICKVLTSHMRSGNVAGTMLKVRTLKQYCKYRTCSNFHTFANLFIEQKGIYCMMGKYASHSVCLSIIFLQTNIYSIR